MKKEKTMRVFLYQTMFYNDEIMVQLALNLYISLPVPLKNLPLIKVFTTIACKV